jgi:hypothetical protein
MAINQNSIKTTIVTVLFAVVLLTMLPSLIPLASNASANLFTTLGNNTVSGIGTEASAFALTLPSLLGWFWVIGPILLVMGIAFAMYSGSKGKGR